MSGTLFLIKRNAIAILVGVVVSILYGCNVVHEQQTKTNHIAALNQWVAELGANDFKLKRHQINQDQWLGNRQVIFRDYLQAESQ